MKNSVLQEKIEGIHGKSLQLLLDVKTRWNSTERMLERFVKVYDCVKDSLREIGQPNLIADSDLTMLTQLLHCLQPIRLASEALGRRDATLMTAEGTLSFLFSKLKQQDNKIAKMFHAAIVEKINQRRSKELISLMRFLLKKNLTSTHELPLISKSQVYKFVKEEACRLIKATVPDASANNDDDVLQLNQPQSLTEELEQAISEFSEPEKTLADPMSSWKVINKELALFDMNGELTTNLQILLDALKSIKPTSTDSERIFSNSANFCSKKRTSLADESINRLCFLKSFFNNTD